MVENLLFSLNRIIPFFLLILLGYGLKRLRVVPEAFLSGLNRYVYRVALPVNLFMNTATTDLEGRQYPRFLLFAFLLTVLSAFSLWGITELLFKDKKLIGTLVQGSFRGNYALLGVPLATAVVGASAAAPAAMALAVIVPTYSILTITVLLSRGNRAEKPKLGSILLSVLSNPLFISTILGIVFSFVGFKLPGILDQTLGQISNTATPMGLIAIGGLFDKKAATARLRPAIYSSAIKLVILPLVMVSLAYALGFRGTDLFLYLIMFGAPVAVSSYSMASELGGDGSLASNILIITTLFSSLTLATGIYIMRTLGWI